MGIPRKGARIGCCSILHSLHRCLLGEHPLHRGIGGIGGDPCSPYFFARVRTRRAMETYGMGFIESRDDPMNEPEIDREEQARRNRELMPDTAAEVDTWRSVFGAGVRLLYAKEGDCQVGKPADARSEQSS